MADLVYMKHPDIDPAGDGPGGSWGPVTRQAFDTTYSLNDWEEADPVTQAASEALGDEVTDLAKLRRDELDEVARSHGLDPDEFATKADLAAAIEDALAPATPE